MSCFPGGDFYDLSIMYSPDGEQWSEFLSDVFRQGDEEIRMYFESIEQLPLHHSQETAIRNSRCQFLLVSPDFTDLFSYTSFRDLVPHPEQVVVLLCGVEHSHLQDIVANMPGYQKWTILSTTDGVPAILQSTFQVINSFEPEPDPESPYMPMAGKSQGDDTYLSMDQSNTRTQDDDTYLSMDQSNSAQEDLYLTMTGSTGADDAEESLYLNMAESEDRYGQDVYEDMEAKPQAVGKFQDTYMVLPTLEDSGTDDSSGPPHRPPKPTQQKSRPDRAIMSKELQLVQPYTVTSGSGERVVLIFKNTLPEGGSYTVEFQGTKQTSVVTATKENPYTLVLSAPDHPPETTQATVKCDGKSLGNATMVFLSKMRRLEELLSDVSKPIEFMCQSLGTEPSDLKTLDKILRKTFKKHMPPNGLGVFGIDQESEEEYAYHPEELPTLMHFVAKYGLKDMCASLLHCPGALNACSIANCDNDFPHNMAEKYGHMDLKKYIEDRIELGAILEEEMGDGYVDMDKDLYMKMTKVDPGYVYMAMGRYYNTHAALREGGYYNFFRGDSTVEEQPDYDHPFPVAIPDLDVYGETLSTNYIKDILQGHEQEPDPEIYDDPDKHEPAPVDPPRRPFSDMRGPSITRKPMRHSYRPPPVEMPPEEKRRSQTLPIGASLQLPDTGASPSSGQDDLAMYTPGQQELIKLQKEVKAGVFTVEEAATMFKAWQMKERDRAMSFDQQKKEMDNLRASVQRRAKKGQPEVGPPIPKHGKDEGIYGRVLTRIRRTNSNEGGQQQEPEAVSRQPRKTPGRLPSYRQPGGGNRESTLSNSSSSSGGSRHSVMSTASLDSGMDVPPEDIPEEEPPPVPMHIPRRSRPLSDKFDDDFIARPVPLPPVSKRPLPREPPPSPTKPCLKSRSTEPDMSPRLKPASIPRPSLPTSSPFSEVTSELAKKFGKLSSSSVDDETSSDRRSPRDSPKQPSSPKPPRPPQRGSNPQPPPRPPRKPMN
ncbi:PREDICTED: phosphoinositide 3-kinase adapter protein 1-like isoform X2 [Branchiostoma belcheri]|uniref:Phosphoinositide 3-kinase adapter protein 1-like isoform X2 n=1 Tax=Branchiostoma belcheri TaxID=7741 RepID=A0A6P4YB20_BRABE|nr:PREDICTED: phosphoinositide 3-kinase adapter protein 1-like isoform X2 [Branchiostoma belcheri]